MAEPSTKLPGHNFFETVTVRVGNDEEEKKDFIVHTSFATKSSKVFQAAFRGAWKEAREKRIPLPEAKVADFQIYVEWLYTGRIVDLVYDGSSNSSATLVRLYILGDYLDDNHFGNAVIDTLAHNSYCLTFECDTVDLAWDKTLPDSPLRELLVQLIICGVVGCHESSYFMDVGTWSKEVSVEIFKQTGEHVRAQGYSTPYHQPWAYHKHDVEGPKCEL